MLLNLQRLSVDTTRAQPSAEIALSLVAKRRAPSERSGGLCPCAESFHGFCFGCGRNFNRLHHGAYIVPEDTSGDFRVSWDPTRGHPLGRGRRPNSSAAPPGRPQASREDSRAAPRAAFSRGYWDTRTQTTDQLSETECTSLCSAHGRSCVESVKLRAATQPHDPHQGPAAGRSTVGACVAHLLPSSEV